MKKSPEIIFPGFFYDILLQENKLPGSGPNTYINLKIMLFLL